MNQAFIDLLSNYANLPEPLRKHCFEVEGEPFKAALCWPDQMLALNVSGAKKAVLKKEGWETGKVSSTEVNAAEPLFAFVETIKALSDDPGAQTQEKDFGNFGVGGLKGLFRFLLEEVPGLPEPKLGVRRTDPLALWEELNIALVGDQADLEALEPEVRCVGFSPEEAPNASRLIALIDRFKFQVLLVQAEAEAEENRSNAETKLLKAMLDIGIEEPDPNRHFYYANGDLATIPDMSWGDLLLVIELDGWFVHIGSELHKVIQSAVRGDPERGKAFMTKAEQQSVRDARKRRRLGELGWAVYVVHDTEVATPENAKKTARSIRAIIEARRQMIVT